MTKSTSFSSFYLDGSLTGHIFLRPSIFLGRTVVRIFSPLDKKSCLGNTVEVIKRIFLSFACLLITIPSALLIPIGLIIKGLASCCRPTIVLKPEDRYFQQSSPPESPSSLLTEETPITPPLSAPPSPKVPVKKSPTPSSSPSAFSEGGNSNIDLIIDEPSPEETAKKENPPKEEGHLFETSSENFSIKWITPDGNCAFYAFQQGGLRKGVFSENKVPSCSQLRKDTAQWIRTHIKSENPPRDFWTHLMGTVEDYFQLKLNRLQQKLDATGQISDTDENKIPRLTKIETKITELEKNLTLLREKEDGYKDLLEAYLKAFELDEPVNKQGKVDLNKRVHASQVEFLALSDLYSVNIRIYGDLKDQAKEKYKLLEKHQCPKKESKNIDFLIKDTHVDLLVVPTEIEKIALIQDILTKAENYITNNDFDKAEKMLDLNLMREFKNNPEFWDVDKKTLEKESESKELALYQKFRELERFIGGVKKIKKQCSPHAATERITTLENEIQVPDDGNCLFHSVIEGLKLLQPDNKAEENHESLRKRTAEWEFKNYHQDPDFKKHVHQSFFAHYNDEKNSLELEHANYLGMMNIPEAKQTALTELKKIDERKKIVDQWNTFCLRLLGCEAVEAKSPPSTEEIDPLVKDYTDVIKIPRKLASRGEMYAMSQLLNVRLELYDGAQKLEAVFEPKKLVPQGTIRIVHLKNHYVCMKPPKQ